MIINMSTSCFDDGAKSAWSVVNWSSFKCLCGVLSFTVHAASSSTAFLGNRFIPLKRFNKTDHASLIVLNCIDIWTLCWPQRDNNYCTGKNFLAYLDCMRCCPFLHKGSSICQRMVINVRLNMRPVDFINSVQLGLCEFGAQHFWGNIIANAPYV